MVKALRTRLWNDERGIALVVALVATLALGIMVTSVIAYTSGNQRASNLSAAEQSAQQLAETGVQQAYAIIQYAKTNSQNPAAPTLLGCAVSTDTTKSDCSSSRGLTFCVNVASGCTAGSPGSAQVWGCYTGTASATCAMPSGTASATTSRWIVYSTGYLRNPNGGATVAHTTTATVKVSAAQTSTTSYVASVWNHMFITGPLVPGQCQLNFGGNSTTITVPLYLIGNLCLPGNTAIQEVSGGQAIDLQVGGKLYMAAGSHVGASSTAPITSGVVVGGCTTVSVSAATSPCDNGAFSYWVKTKDTFIANDAPSQTPSDIAHDYSTFDPGPMHTCSSGWDPFDVDMVQNDNAPTFDLTPSTAYSCVSKNGSGAGQLSWDPSTATLTVGGSIYFDGDVTMSRSATYTGTAIIETSGTFTMSTNNISLCATSGCNFSSWQGSSGNNSMLTIASVKDNATSISMTGNHETFQGSMWTQPDASVSFGSNSVTVQGPISVGSITSSMNNTTIQTLPAIKNMPLGAPIPPNTPVSVDSLVYTSG